MFVKLLRRFVSPFWKPRRQTRVGKEVADLGAKVVKELVDIATDSSEICSQAGSFFYSGSFEGRFQFLRGRWLDRGR